MIQIKYLNYDFRHIIWIWKDLHPDYYDDLKFIDIANKFEKIKNVQIEICGSVFTFQDLDDQNNFIKFTDYVLYEIIADAYSWKWDSPFLKALYDKSIQFNTLDLYWK